MGAIKNTEIYSGVSDCPILYFMLAMGTGDYKYIIKNYETKDKSLIDWWSNEGKEQLFAVFSKMREDYQKLIFNKKELKKQQELNNVIYLQSRYSILLETQFLIEKSGDPVFYEIAESVGVRFNKNDDDDAKRKKLEQATKVAKNKANIKRINFEKKYDVTTLEEEITNPLEIEKNLDSAALDLERGLETGYRIDIKKTSVLRWVNLSKSLEAKITQMN